MPLLSDQARYEAIFGKPTGERGTTQYKTPRRVRGNPGARAKGLCAPTVVSDAIEVQSMADGQVYDSKSRYHQSLKDQGLCVVEGPRAESYDMSDAPIVTPSDVKDAHEQAEAILNR